jgi:hypothetical protein
MSPDFLWGLSDPTNFMRLSSQKAAHATFREAAYRKSGISLVFREMWDSTAANLRLRPSQ